MTERAMVCRRKLAAIAAMFGRRCRITLLVRDPDSDQAGLLLTSDQLGDAMAALGRARRREASRRKGR